LFHFTYKDLLVHKFSDVYKRVSQTSFGIVVVRQAATNVTFVPCR